MSAHSKYDKQKGPPDYLLRVVLYLGMAGLLILSLLNYKLRDGFSDASYYLMDMTRNGGFVIAHNRIVCVLTQWLPALLMQFGASFKTLAISYSFCYSLAPVLMALLALHWLRQPFTALAILLLFTLMNAQLFYYPVSELQTGLGLLLLYNGIVDYSNAREGRNRRLVLASLILAPLIAFSHPMALPTFVCWLFYRFINDKAGWKKLSIIALLFFAAFLVKQFLFLSNYESSKVFGWEQFKPFGINYYYGPLGQSFLSYVPRNAIGMLIVLACTITLLTYHRKWKLLATTLVSIVALYTLVMIAFEQFDGSHKYDHYYEHYLQPCVLFLVLTFTTAIASFHLEGRIKAAAIGTVLLISFIHIINRSEWHERRQRWQCSYLNMMDSLQVKKAVVHRKWGPERMWIPSFWSSSTETLFLSSLKGPEHSKTLYMSWDINDIDEPYQQPDKILLDGSSLEQSTLPTRYFRLGNKPYVILEHVVPDTVLARLRRP
jgi:hypothetical protein